MAGSFNKVFLMGNLTRDVELRHTSSNMAIGKFGIAVNRRFKTQSGEQREEVTFVDCDVFGRTAEVMSQYLHKGRPVFIEGRLKLDQWEAKDGTKRSRLLVVVENFQFVDSGGGGGGGDSRGGGSYASGGYADEGPTGVGTDTGGGGAPIQADDIPF